VAITTSQHDKTVRTWDLITFTQRPTLHGHEHQLQAVASTTIDNRPVAITTSWDRTARIWDLVTNSYRATLSGHTGGVSSVTYTSIDDRPVAITTGHDNTLRMWNLDTATPLAVFDFPAHIGGTLYVESEQWLVVATGWDLVVLERRANR
jgi:WD40 repeat protein